LTDTVGLLGLLLHPAVADKLRANSKDEDSIARLFISKYPLNYQLKDRC
jgi:hypothetical protein